MRTYRGALVHQSLCGKCLLSGALDRWTGLCGRRAYIMANTRLLPCCRACQPLDKPSTCRGCHGPFRVPYGNTSPLPYPIGSDPVQPKLRVVLASFVLSVYVRTQDLSPKSNGHPIRLETNQQRPGARKAAYKGGPGMTRQKTGFHRC